MKAFLRGFSRYQLGPTNQSTSPPQAPPIRAHPSHIREEATHAASSGSPPRWVSCRGASVLLEMQDGYTFVVPKAQQAWEQTSCDSPAGAPVPPGGPSAVSLTLEERTGLHPERDSQSMRPGCRRRQPGWLTWDDLWGSMRSDLCVPGLARGLNFCTHDRVRNREAAVESQGCCG